MFFCHYKVWQKIFDRYTDKVNFKQGMPSLGGLKKSRDASPLLEDLMFANFEFLFKIYSVYSHHICLSVLMNMQNYFHKGLCEISFNAQIMLLFKSCRKVIYIAHFLQQIYSKTYKNALEAYKDAISSARGYLVNDFCCKTHHNQQLRLGISPKDTYYLY